MVETNLPWLEELARVTSGWIGEGRTPYVFMHSADDFYTPRLAREFHRLVGQHLAIGDMPSWPVAEQGPDIEQLSLF